MPIFGRWASDNSILEIERDATARCTRRSSRSSIRSTSEGEDGPVGTVRVDLHNPDRSFARVRSSESICSSGYQYKDGKWQGQLYDPESGKTYKSQITRRFRRQAADARLHRHADVRPHGGLRAGVELYRRNIREDVGGGRNSESLLRLTGTV